MRQRLVFCFVIAVVAVACFASVSARSDDDTYYVTLSSSGTTIRCDARYFVAEGTATLNVQAWLYDPNNVLIDSSEVSAGGKTQLTAQAGGSYTTAGLYRCYARFHKDGEFIGDVTGTRNFSF